MKISKKIFNYLFNIKSFSNNKVLKAINITQKVSDKYDVKNIHNVILESGANELSKSVAIYEKIK